MEIKKSEGDVTYENNNWAKISASGVTFLDAGKGPPVLFLHAFPLSSAMWRQQIEAFRKDYRVVAPDFRGFGSTPGFAGAPSVDQMADDVAGLLGELKIQQPVVICGLSMGGYVALAFAPRRAAQLRALILADTRAEADDAAARANREKMIEFASKNPSLAVVERMMPSLPVHRHTGQTAGGRRGGSAHRIGPGARRHRQRPAGGARPTRRHAPP